MHAEDVPVPRTMPQFRPEGNASYASGPPLAPAKEANSGISPLRPSECLQSRDVQDDPNITKTMLSCKPEGLSRGSLVIEPQGPTFLWHV